MYRRAARHNAAVEWRLVRAECYVCAVDVGVGECAGGLCVCVSWGVSASGLVGREVCVCALSVKKEADDGTRDRGASREVRTDWRVR